ncbi:hypothetical protein P22_1406 [Propionispora sp. 2/2-37]|uniref:hypothetical protein n=1 Tax=Propionispora sp. 2/2-37 TaxID=1677858 RepID=UPI0006BB5FBC|nr:hypothetical protein [Propionispora sp. 2/2-37]CUH95336.1 hypothetical protein P22_1406 [Propionispora sp. 2/2-37]
MRIIGVLLFLVCIPLLCFAETRYITATGTYIMGDGETPAAAQEKALLNAKRSAIEQAGVYIESYSKTENLQLTRDEVNALSSGVLQITSSKVQRALTSDGALSFSAEITCLATIDDISAMRQRLKELQASPAPSSDRPLSDPVSKKMPDGSEINYNPLLDQLTIYKDGRQIMIYANVRGFVQTNDTQVIHMLDMLGVDWRALLH